VLRDLAKSAAWFGINQQPSCPTLQFTQIDVPGAVSTFAFRNNDLGHVVGEYLDGTRAFGFLKVGSQFTTIDVPGSVRSSQALGINSAGDIVGEFDGRAFLKSGATISPIDVPGAATTTAYAINDAGIVVGTFFDGSNHGFIKTGGSFQTIDFPGAVGPLGTSIFGINNAGAVVGVYYDATGRSHGFLRDATGFTSFDVPGAVDTMLHGINDSNDIVGRYGDSNRRFPFTRIAGTIITLDVPGLAPSGSGMATGINNAGEIVGGFDGADAQHGFLAR